MEPKATTVEAIAKNVVETEEITQAETPTTVESTKPLVSLTESTPSITSAAAEVAPQISNNVWEQVTQLWDEYFGEGKKSNLTIAIIVITTIPLLIAASALLDFLNKLPLLPSIFELVGFGYSGWFIYRYLLLANTRKELTDAIATWKNKVFG